jgi:hypothetical protein
MYTLSEEMVRRGHRVSIMSAGPKKDTSAITIYEKNLGFGVEHVRIGFPLDIGTGKKFHIFHKNR